jgi:hypothetical protein
LRAGDSRSVQTSAESSFKDCERGAGFAKRQQRDRGQMFEESRQRFDDVLITQFFSSVAHGCGKRSELRFADLLTVDRDSFAN